MHALAAVGISSLLLLACTATRSPDPALLISWKPLGVSCADPVVGQPDNNPQRVCQATIRDLAVGLTFIADDAGVVDITAQVPAGTDPAKARAVFDDLVSTMAAFPDGRTSVMRWIGTWGGGQGQTSIEFAGGRATIESDAIWIGLYVARVPLYVPSS